jgi:hypothetical protein
MADISVVESRRASCSNALALRRVGDVDEEVRVSRLALRIGYQDADIEILLLDTGEVIRRLYGVKDRVNSTLDQYRASLLAVINSGSAGGIPSSGTLARREAAQPVGEFDPEAAADATFKYFISQLQREVVHLLWVRRGHRRADRMPRRRGVVEADDGELGG